MNKTEEGEEEEWEGVSSLFTNGKALLIFFSEGFIIECYCKIFYAFETFIPIFFSFFLFFSLNNLNDTRNSTAICYDNYSKNLEHSTS